MALIARCVPALMIAMETATAMMVSATASQVGLVLSARCWVAPMIVWATAGVTKECVDAIQVSQVLTVSIEAALMDALAMAVATLTTPANAIWATQDSIAR